VTTSSETQGVISDITGNQSFQQKTVTNSGTDNSTNVVGRKKGATKQKKKECIQNHTKVIKKNCILFKEKDKEARKMLRLEFLVEP
jgi:hypothetical protein